LTPHVSMNNAKNTSQGASTTTPLASTKRVMEGGEMKLPLFHGNGSEDPQQHWFLCEALWRVKQVIDVDMKATQVVTTFRDRALNWFMKFSRGQPKTLNEIQIALIAKFKQPKSETQCII